MSKTQNEKSRIDKTLSALEKIIDKQQEKVAKSLSKLKSILAEESSETKEMLETYAQYINGTAKEEDMDRANDQMKDLMKMTGLGFLAILPFAPISIPLIVKLGEKLGIQILPSSFRNDKTS